MKVWDLVTKPAPNTRGPAEKEESTAAASGWVQAGLTRMSEQYQRQEG